MLVTTRLVSRGYLESREPGSAIVSLRKGLDDGPQHITSQHLASKHLDSQPHPFKNDLLTVACCLLRFQPKQKTFSHLFSRHPFLTFRFLFLLTNKSNTKFYWLFFFRVYPCQIKSKRKFKQAKTMSLFVSVTQTVKSKIYLELKLYKKLICISHHFIGTEQWFTDNF